MNQNGMSLCGLVKPPNEIFDSLINFNAPLRPRFEEYIYVGAHPQWPPPSIMCCVCPALDSHGKPLPATHFISYRTVSSCYPFVYQEDVAIADDEYLFWCMGDTPELCNVF